MGSIDLPELDQILENQTLIMKQLSELRTNNNLPEYIDLRTACELKGVNYDTVKNRQGLQPDRSKRVMVSGRWMYPRDVIVDWLRKTDADLSYVPKPKYPKLRIVD